MKGLTPQGRNCCRFFFSFFCSSVQDPHLNPPPPPSTSLSLSLAVPARPAGTLSVIIHRTRSGWESVAWFLSSLLSSFLHPFMLAIFSYIMYLYLLHFIPSFFPFFFLSVFISIWLSFFNLSLSSSILFYCPPPMFIFLPFFVSYILSSSFCLYSAPFLEIILKSICRSIYHTRNLLNDKKKGWGSVLIKVRTNKEGNEKNIWHVRQLIL